MNEPADPYDEWRRALGTGDLRRIRAAAAELPRIGIAEAAAMLLVIERAEPDTYERAAKRWVGMLCLQRAKVTLEDIAQAAMALEALPQTPETARRVLGDICRQAELPDVAKVFDP
jgi:hypothetical protein